MGDGVSHELLAGWLSGRSLARRLPAPVEDRGGFRVDTGSEAEACRWLFAAPCPGLAELGREISAPGHPLKLCGEALELARVLPDRWTVELTGWFMVSTTEISSQALPQGYRLVVAQEGPVTEAKVLAPSGDLAASGYGGETSAGFVFDRIVTEPDHRRRGLGRAVMAALGSAQTDLGAPKLLVATPVGRLLYESLGWRALSPYATATFKEFVA